MTWHYFSKLVIHILHNQKWPSWVYPWQTSVHVCLEMCTIMLSAAMFILLSIRNISHVHQQKWRERTVKESAFPLLGIYPRGMKANVSRKPCMKTSRAALSETAPKLKRGQVAISGRMHQLCCIHTVKQVLSMKKQTYDCVTARMNLKNIKLRTCQVVQWLRLSSQSRGHRFNSWLGD